MSQQRIGCYQLEKKIGQGSMGAVFAATDGHGGRVAIKVLRRELAERQQVVARFLNEARIARLVTHPGLVNGISSGRLPDGRPYLVMEYLRGDLLRDLLARSPAPGRPRLLRLGLQLAEALAAAHACGVAHRDLKPENVIVVRDLSAPGGEQARILDFGLAKAAGDDPGDGEDEVTCIETQIGTCMGTPTYMAPEQCRGLGGVTTQADVYALGVILYRMLAGRPPFMSDSPMEVMAQHLCQTPQGLWSIDRGIPTDLSALVQALLVKDPASRPTMGEVAKRLLPFVERAAPAGQAQRVPAAQPVHPTTIQTCRAAHSMVPSFAAHRASMTRQAPPSSSPRPALASRPTEMFFRADPVIAAPWIERQRQGRTAPLLATGIALGALFVLAALADCRSASPAQLARAFLMVTPSTSPAQPKSAGSTFSGGCALRNSATSSVPAR